MVDVNAEAAKLLKEVRSPAQARMELEAKGFSTDDVAHALAERTDARTGEDRRNSFLFSTREVFDRIGYGGATPQFVNILFWLSQQAHPYILVIVGLLNGFKTLLSVVWSSIMQEYSKLNRISKNSIAAGGIIFGFSFLFMSFGLLLHNELGLWIFSASFLLGAGGAVAYGDLYQKFVRDTIRKERMGWFLRSIATWGVIITALTLMLAGYLMDLYPMAGVPWTLEVMGYTFNMRLYGFLLAFEITAFAFIISGYVSSLTIDKREEKSYPFTQFLREYYSIITHKIGPVMRNKYVALLLFATIISGFLQIVITAYSGIAIYQIIAKNYPDPFFTIAVMYAIAIIASFTGPFFTERMHRITGLAPTLVFGTLLMAILPLVIVYNPNVATITAALCTYVIGGAIVGFAQGLLAQKLMDEDTRRGYFQTQTFTIIIPYLLLIPVMALATMLFPLKTLFLAVAAGLIIIVMPLYFILVTISQRLKL